MPAYFDARDRQLVIGAVVLMLVLLGLTYLLRPVPAKQTIGIPSSYSTEWLGAKAAFLLLQQSGYRVERWESPPEELPEDAAGTTLIFAEPSERGSGADDVQGIRAHAAKGSHGGVHASGNELLGAFLQFAGLICFAGHRSSTAG